MRSEKIRYLMVLLGSTSVPPFNACHYQQPPTMGLTPLCFRPSRLESGHPLHIGPHITTSFVFSFDPTHPSQILFLRIPHTPIYPSLYPLPTPLSHSQYLIDSIIFILNEASSGKKVDYILDYISFEVNN
ncbi:hypothetical protein VNO77_24448 [Canavalia gladiata]|uniref:Uncharacterized protein n=1 Tax=Canavalia gladiata TaxID=3824 RepID=A0AAN9Q9Y3_CANGL